MVHDTYAHRHRHMQAHTHTGYVGALTSGTFATFVAVVTATSWDEHVVKGWANSPLRRECLPDLGILSSRWWEGGGWDHRMCGSEYVMVARERREKSCTHYFVPCVMIQRTSHGISLSILEHTTPSQLPLTLNIYCYRQRTRHPKVTVTRPASVVSCQVTASNFPSSHTATVMNNKTQAGGVATRATRWSGANRTVP